MFKQQKDLELYQTENNNAHIDDVETVEEEDEDHVDYIEEDENICGNLGRVVTNEDRLQHVEGYMSRSMSGIHLSGPLRCKFDNQLVTKNMDKTKYRYFCDNKLETGVKLPPLADMHRGLNRKFSE